jgi:hypothetical protein
MNKLNDRLERVQVGRDKEVPIESDTRLWLLWIYEDKDFGLNWDAEVINRDTFLALKDKLPYIKLIFCTWHGQHRTNLFLMDKHELIKRLGKLYA